MAVVIILLLTCLVLGGLSLVMPQRLRSLIGPPEIAAALVLPVLGALSPFYLVFATGVAVVVGFLPMLATTDPAQLMERRLQLMFFCMPLMPLAQATLMVSSFTIVQVNYTILLCIAAAAAMLTAGYRAPTARLATWDLTFAAMMLMQLFMDARSSDVTFFIRAVVQVTIGLGLPYFVVSRAFATTRQPAKLLMALLLATSVIAVVAFFESARHWLLYDNIARNVGSETVLVSGYSKLRGGMLRAHATFPESTGMSLFFSVALVILFALRRHIGSTRLVVVMAAALAAGLIATFARVGWLAVAVGLCLCLWYERRYRTLAALLIGLPIVALALITLGDALPVVAAAIGTGEDSVGSVDYRSMLIDAGLEVVRQNPVIGLSMDDMLVQLEPLRQGEGIIDLVNEPLVILMRAGLVGGALYFLMTLRVLVTLFTQRRRLDIESQACAAACFASIVALLLGLSTTSFGRNQASFVILLGVGAGLLARLPVRGQNRAANTALPSSPAASPATAVPSITSS